MTIDLSAIPYQHRSGGASLLIAKANRLLGVTSAATDHASSREAKPVRAAVAYFDLALSLMKPYDPNYSTIVNWKCNALVRLGQYEEAVRWYREIVRLSALTAGHAGGDATAALAEKMIAQYAGRKNAELPPESREETNAFDDPPYCMHGEAFCRLLAEGKFKRAHAGLSDALRGKMSVAELKARWRSLVGPTDRQSVEILLGEHLTDWPGRRAQEIGWCYYTVCGEDLNEGLSLVVAKTPSHTHTISAVEFGRP
ncbi:MAG: hypothetical protein NTV51_19645 [Verrucomicrobia bacterium]|nr:hypothetical protein [Verrucomicrobiota bacterium]